MNLSVTPEVERTVVSTHSEVNLEFTSTALPDAAQERISECVLFFLCVS